jgi:hypothetical protein
MAADNPTIARYLQRAAELRAIARQIQDPQDREVVLRAAEAYEEMAKWKPTKPVTKS